MTKLAFALLLTAFASTATLAQGPAEPIGVVQSVEGLVTVSQGNTLGNVVKDKKILNGARLVATATGFAVVKLDNGCLVSLKPNQAVTIDSRLDCKAVVAGIETSGAAAAAGIDSSSALKAAIVGGIGLALVVNSDSSNSNSPPPASGS